MFSLINYSYITKNGLYNYLFSLRKKYDLSNTPLDTISFVKTLNNISLEYADFKSRGLCGIAFKGENSDTIILNKKEVYKNKFSIAVTN